MAGDVTIDISGLHWIRQDIDEKLREARLSLEDFVEERRDELNDAVKALHQVQGALSIARIYGAAMFADELEAVALALNCGQVEEKQAAAEALMLGIVQLPAYLEGIERGKADIPLGLLPLMNDLRAARQGPAVTEASLFAPRLNAQITAEPVTAGSGNPELPEIIRTQRLIYHRALLNWVKGIDLARGLKDLQDIVDRISSAAGTVRLRRLLDAAEALLRALRDDSIEKTSDARLVFSRLDRVFKKIIDEGEESAVQDFPLDLLKRMLYLVVRSNSQDPVVKAVQESADLANSFPEVAADERQPGGPLGRELFDAVGDALQEDLGQIKDSLELYMRDGRGDLARIEAVVDSIRRIADTLAMVGRGDLRARLAVHCEVVMTSLAEKQEPADDVLMGLAADLMAVESALQGLSEMPEQDANDADDSTSSDTETRVVSISAAEYLQHVQAAVDIVLVEFARIRETLGAYLESPEQKEPLADMPAVLHAIGGALQVINQPRVSSLVEGLNRYLQCLSGGGCKPPTADEADALADLFAGTEYYLRHLSQPALDHAKAIEVAEDALKKLPVPPPATEAAASIPTGTVAGGFEEGVWSDETVSPDLVTQVEEDAGPDTEILDIFFEEAREELAAIEEQYPLWRADASQQDALIRLRRAFHTLKGSGRLVGATGIGDFAWAIENLLNRVIDATVEPGAELFALLDETVELLPLLIDSLEQGEAPDSRPLALQEWAFELAAGGDSTSASGGSAGPTSQQAEAAGQEALDRPEYIQEETQPTAEALSGDELPREDQNAAVSTETTLADFPDSQESPVTGGEERHAKAGDVGLDAEESILMPVSETPATIELEPALFEVFKREAEAHLGTVSDFVEHCRRIPGGCTYGEALQRALHTLRGSAHMAEVESIAAVAGGLEKWVELLARMGRHTDQDSLDLLDRGRFIIDTLLGLINEPGGNMPAWEAFAREVEQQLVSLEQGPGEPGDTKPGSAEAAGYDQELADIYVEEARELVDMLESAYARWHSDFEALAPLTELQRGLHTMKGGARLASLASIGDLAHATESLLESIVEHRVDVSADIQGLVRQTLDALAGQVEALEKQLPLEAYPQLIESLEAAARGEAWAAAEVSSGIVEPITVGEDDTPESISESLLEMESGPEAAEVEEEDLALLSDSQLLTDSELLDESDSADQSDLLSPSSLVPGDGDLISTLSEDSRIIRFPEREPRKAADEAPLHRPPPPPPEKDDLAEAPRERIRVSANLLDQMVNNVGEISIYGARLEQQNKVLGYNLEELSQTIGRLKEQLRKLENETEAQILSRYEREHQGDLPDGFDPLELDRYSGMQQLSRALSETTDDLTNIASTMEELGLDTESLLQQQGRIVNDLQDGLLHTRMVPVGSRASRFQRVVRQTAQSLGKQAELETEGEQGEMDRTILERMMGPLEHLFRNAVAHGIESPEERVSLGKPARGTVSLSVGREGSEVVLAVSDDGRGLDREAIRRKAVEKGLLDPAAQLDDKELDAFILKAGFSTTDEVSQVAGRGVGMDVVVNEIKQLGGSLAIESQPGKGTRFTIHLPLTLAISEALLVTVGEEIYAVPHGSLDGIARIAREELVACYRGEQDNYTYDGRDYKVRYLGSLLGLAAPKVPEAGRWQPVLLVRSGEHRLAIQVDGLLGNHQVVVKSVGTQLSSIHWFNGGTILADGRIALILDMNAVVSADNVRQAMPQPPAQETDEAEGIKVMVVDDSITVRKVTSRLLERHNMQVLTARDGVDALALLQNERPDVMLLDIEMPRMDGFELARHLHSTAGLQDIPVIMITSRTGTKHRLHAVELGVRRYLGKPYQEAELLENIYSVLAEAGS